LFVERVEESISTWRLLSLFLVAQKLRQYKPKDISNHKNNLDKDFSGKKDIKLYSNFANECLINV